jgi:hypothetical protein
MTKDCYVARIEDCRRFLVYHRARYLRQSLKGVSYPNLELTHHWIDHYEEEIQKNLASLAKYHQQEGTQ